MNVRLAWDGQYYTKTDFLLWYGRERGFDLWDCNSEPQHVENIVISFILMSGEKVCKDLVVIYGCHSSGRASYLVGALW